MKSREESLERLQAALAGREVRFVEARDGMPTLEVEREHLHDVLATLHERAGFQTVTLITGVDHQRDVPGGAPAETRLEVVYQLHSLAHGDRVRIETRLSAEDPHVQTCTDLWPGAGFMERECFDMFGIVFDGHRDLRRLLMPDGYGHHPLRKDFPHKGIEPDRLYREWDRERRSEAAGGRR